jgi:hypothetical protein
MTIEHSVDKPFSFTSGNGESLRDDSNIAVAILDAGIEASKNGGFSELKVKTSPDSPWIPIGEYLSARPFYELTMSNQVRSALQDKYALIAREYYELHHPPIEEVVVEEPTLSKAAEASAQIVDQPVSKHEPKANLGDRAIHGTRPADLSEIIANDIDKG